MHEFENKHFLRSWWIILFKPGQFHQMVDLLTESVRSLRSPHQPKFENVVVASTLDSFITRVIGHIVALVGLEEITCLEWVAGFQDTLGLKMESKYIWVKHFPGGVLGSDCSGLPSLVWSLVLLFLSLAPHAPQSSAHFCLAKHGRTWRFHNKFWW